MLNNGYIPFLPPPPLGIRLSGCAYFFLWYLFFMASLFFLLFYGVLFFLYFFLCIQIDVILHFSFSWEFFKAPQFFLYISPSQFTIGLHTKNQLPRWSGSALKVLSGGWWVGGGSTVTLVFSFGPIRPGLKLWFWTWTKLNKNPLT